MRTRIYPAYPLVWIYGLSGGPGGRGRSPRRRSPTGTGSAGGWGCPRGPPPAARRSRSQSCPCQQPGRLAAEAEVAA
eukprot:389543-Prorocentrum_minimum.AAC.2